MPYSFLRTKTAVTTARYRNSGIPIVETADYMERTPLARAEWMRFYGRLYGKGALADSIFDITEQRYLEIKRKGGEERRPAQGSVRQNLQRCMECADIRIGDRSIY